MAGKAFNFGSPLASVYVKTATANSTYRLTREYMSDTSADTITVSGRKPGGVFVQCGTIAQIAAGTRANGAIVNWLAEPDRTAGEGIVMYPGDTLNMDVAETVTGFRWANAVAGSNATMQFLLFA